jgi:hypothetical protein
MGNFVSCSWIAAWPTLQDLAQATQEQVGRVEGSSLFWGGCYTFAYNTSGFAYHDKNRQSEPWSDTQGTITGVAPAAELLLKPVCC